MLTQEANEEQGGPGQAAGFEVQCDGAVRHCGDKGCELGIEDESWLDGLSSEGSLRSQVLLAGCDQAWAVWPEVFEGETDAEVLAAAGFDDFAGAEEAGNVR